MIFFVMDMDGIPRNEDGGFNADGCPGVLVQAEDSSDAAKQLAMGLTATENGKYPFEIFVIPISKIEGGMYRVDKPKTH